jgi:hypothetical protein
VSIMGLRKYQKVEDAKPLPREEQEKIAANLHKVGKTSARDLTDTERKSALDNQR